LIFTFYDNFIPPVFPSLLLPLVSPVRVIRHTALSCLTTLSSQPHPPEHHPFHTLTQLLASHQLEIIADSAAVIEVIASTASQPTKKRRKSSKVTGQDVGVACVLGHVVEYGMPRACQVGLLRVLTGFNHKVQ